jgi:hypothetical protein
MAIRIEMYYVFALFMTIELSIGKHIRDNIYSKADKIIASL